MKKIIYIISIILLSTSACSELEFEINEDYEQAEIIDVELYSRAMTRANKTTLIDTEEASVLITLRSGKDISDLKIAITASTGTSINPSMSVGFQDFSSPKSYVITSPNKTVEKTWTITVINP